MKERERTTESGKAVFSLVSIRFCPVVSRDLCTTACFCLFFPCGFSNIPPPLPAFFKLLTISSATLGISLYFLKQIFTRILASSSVPIIFYLFFFWEDGVTRHRAGHGVLGRFGRLADRQQRQPFDHRRSGWAIQKWIPKCCPWEWESRKCLLVVLLALYPRTECSLGPITHALRSGHG